MIPCTSGVNIPRPSSGAANWDGTGAVSGAGSPWPIRRRHLHIARCSTPDLALIVYLCEWQFETADSDLRNSGQDWVTAILRRRDDGWRFIHQAELATFNADVIAAADTRE